MRETEIIEVTNQSKIAEYSCSSSARVGVSQADQYTSQYEHLVTNKISTVYISSDNASIATWCHNSQK